MNESEHKPLLRLSVNMDNVRDLLTFLNDEVAQHAKDIQNIKNLLANMVTVKQFNELERMVTDINDNVYQKFDELYPAYSDLSKEVENKIKTMQNQYDSGTAGIYQELSTKINKIQDNVDPLLSMQSKLNNYIEKMDSFLSSSGDFSKMKSIIDINNRLVSLERGSRERDESDREYRIYVDERFDRLELNINTISNSLNNMNSNINSAFKEQDDKETQTHQEKEPNDNNNEKSEEEIINSLNELNKISIDSRTLEPNKPNDQSTPLKSKKDDIRSKITKLEIPVSIPNMGPKTASSREIGNLMKVIVSSRSSQPSPKLLRKYPNSSRK
ncbi:hypothetical protein TVAG_317240 [Trichomonas vaginalis G3]|uniref:Uncharacterized protein n=1 Tax=Trichomonas vaginalis (strain ATCC PRA-98 / G3) TaxID=412133 RepID=A2FQZ9_TRIV3|nr:Type IV secretion system protein TraC family [Trichomonas vaginalis G3]EAX92666.1 hypothetical protein TVAG_317240 [Trichomonas vaginalis G3]KAI5512059.1 Type IV secretion system protein TraC family [Trichomonas vaginalis G3]|eukprot:XP_001305596.1 hypothetical protein [Trichomonas vaginalis G3]